MAIPRPSNSTRPTGRPTPATKPVEVQSQNFESAIVNTKHLKFDQLTTYISGQSWDVDWYQLIRGKDDDIRPFEMDTHPVYQQYKLIKGLELKVTSALESSQIDETKEMVLRGSANVYGIIIPTEGCMFLADVGDGREGLFSVTSTARMSHYSSAVYEIEYQLVSFTDRDTRKELARKVVETSVFHKDFLDSGNDPILSTEETGLVNRMREHYSRLISIYFHDFFSRNFKTLLVPNQRMITYDPFVVKFIRTIISTDEYPEMRNVTEFNVQGDQAMYEFTLWHCLEVMDYSMLAMSAYNAGLVDITHFFNIKPSLNSIYYTGVEKVVYPNMKPTHVDKGYGESRLGIPDMENVIRGSARFGELDRLMLDTLELDPTLEIYEAISPERASQIKRVTVDDYYVLSESFYRHGPDVPMSKLEALTMSALKGDPLDLRTLDHLCTQSPKWDNVERFYYLPILIALLKIYKRRMK